MQNMKCEETSQDKKKDKNKLLFDEKIPRLISGMKSENKFLFAEVEKICFPDVFFESAHDYLLHPLHIPHPRGKYPKQTNIFH